MKQIHLPENENINLRRLKYSPIENPFMARGSEIRTRHKTVKTRAARQELVDSETGELVAMSMIHVIEEKDEERFVKVFADGVKAAFDLSRAGSRVFQTVLGKYHREKMTGGYSDSLTLYWFGDGLNGEKIDMSEKSFQRGLKELISKEFLKPKSPNQYGLILLCSLREIAWPLCENIDLHLRKNRQSKRKSYRLRKRLCLIRL